MKIKEGTCLKLTREKVTEAICLKVEKNWMCEEEGNIYTFLCHDCNNVNAIKNEFDILYISRYGENTLNEIECEVISNTHFFTVDELVETIMDIPGFLTLLGVGYCYGEDYYDSRDEDEKSQHVFLQSNNSYFQIIIPENLYYNDSYLIPYVYVKKTKDNLIDKDAYDFSYKYNNYDKQFDPEVLTIKSFTDFANEAYDGLRVPKVDDVKGILLGEVIIYDFFNNEGVITFGNGIMEKHDSDY